MMCGEERARGRGRGWGGGGGGVRADARDWFTEGPRKRESKRAGGQEYSKIISFAGRFRAAGHPGRPAARPVFWAPCFGDGRVACAARCMVKVVGTKAGRPGSDQGSEKVCAEQTACDFPRFCVTRRGRSSARWRVWGFRTRRGRGGGGEGRGGEKRAVPIVAPPPHIHALLPHALTHAK